MSDAVAPARHHPQPAAVRDGGRRSVFRRKILEHRCRIEEFTGVQRALDVGKAHVLAGHQARLILL